MSGNERLSIGEWATETAWRVGEHLHRRRPLRGAAGRDGAADDGSTPGGVRRRRQRGDPGPPPGWSTTFDRPTVPTYPYDESATDPTAFRPLAGASNPVLTADDVTDFGDAHFVADPFLMGGPDGTLHLFVEVFNRRRSPTAAIGHATSDDGGRTWAYEGVVLEESVHLSFPYVFRYGGEYYMIPDRWDRDRPTTIDLYRAESFPEAWTRVARLAAPDRPRHDFVAFRWRERWWGVAGDGSELAVFSSDELERDDWEPHPENPVVTDRPRGARPGGRPIVRPDHVVLFLQDCTGGYGQRVRAFRVDRLSRTRYGDGERADSPVLEPDGGRFGWNSGRMHHVDPWYTGEEWVCAVDGNVDLRFGVFGKYHWSIGIYTAGDRRPAEGRGSDA